MWPGDTCHQGLTHQRLHHFKFKKQQLPAHSLLTPSLNNYSVKRMECTPATAISSSSKAVSTSLSTAPGLQVASLSCPFHTLWLLTAQASACSRPPHHPPDHVTGASGIPVTSTTQQPSAMLHPPWHPPHHVTITSAISVPLPSEKQATLTQGCKYDSTAYNSSMRDIYRMVTAFGHPNFRGARLPLPSNFDFHGWSSIARQIKRCYNI